MGRDGGKEKKHKKDKHKSKDKKRRRDSSSSDSDSSDDERRKRKRAEKLVGGGPQLHGIAAARRGRGWLAHPGREAVRRGLHAEPRSLPPAPERRCCRARRRRS
jgi:hypothetical protein